MILITLFNKVVTPVPLELARQFDDMQLKNSIFRIKILAVLGLFFKILEFFMLVIISKHTHIDDFFTIRTSIELTIIAVSAIFYLPNIKKINKAVLWMICYVIIFSLYVVYSFDMFLAEIASFIPPMLFSYAFLFTMLPDFKPKIFISFISLFQIASVSIVLYKYNFVEGYFRSYTEYIGILMNSVVLIAFVLVLKILLYNNKVKIYVSTHKINSLNTRLQDYNQNLEEMVNNKTQTIVELKNAVMETMADLVERRDDMTGGHISRTSAYLKTVIDSMVQKGLYGDQTATWDIVQMVLSAQLHDVGKIVIDDSILRKPGKLDDEEFEKMKKHTIFGGEIIKEIQEKTKESDFLNYAYLFAVYHHEKWDGSGYPFGIAGEKIPLPARLMAIIDVYDALISERPYKKPFSHKESMKIIMDSKGSHFDPRLVEIFVSSFV